jgi:hypothetical protein
MSRLPDLPGIITADEIAETARSIAALQLPNGMIPWYEGGHCDPWNHVETAMALDVAGLHTEAEHAYEWLADVQHPGGSWFNYYFPDGTIEDDKLDTNVCAYIATGVWHHWLCTWDRGFVDHLWPTVVKALDWVVSMQLPTGGILWAREVDTRPWDYALLTGSSSIWHALECGIQLASLVSEQRPAWESTLDTLGDAIRNDPTAFEPKLRWAMDWYYPVLGNVLTAEAAKARLGESWSTFVMDGLGVRCVSDEPWVTAAETAECSIAHAGAGDLSTATDLLAWTRPHRAPDGAYFTGLVHPDGITFPSSETTAYSAAAVILAADAITATSQAARVFHPNAQTQGQ